MHAAVPLPASDWGRAARWQRAAAGRHGDEAYSNAQVMCALVATRYVCWTRTHCAAAGDDSRGGGAWGPRMPIANVPSGRPSRRPELGLQCCAAL